MTVVRMLKRHAPAGMFATALENAPRSAFAGALAKLRGTRSGLPDWWFVWCGASVCIELKSRAGIASKAQRQIRDELLAAGVKHWWLCRTARAFLLALHLSGIPLRNYTPPAKLEPFAGPFPDPYARLPMHPAVRHERQAAARRYRERRRQREAAMLVAERPDRKGTLTVVASLTTTATTSPLDGQQRRSGGRRSDTR